LDSYGRLRMHLRRMHYSSSHRVRDICRVEEGPNADLSSWYPDWDIPDHQ